MLGTSLSNAVARQWLLNYEAAYGRIQDVDEAVRAGLKPVPERIIDRMVLKLHLRMHRAKQVDFCVVEVEEPDYNKAGWR